MIKTTGPYLLFLLLLNHGIALAQDPQFPECHNIVNGIKSIPDPDKREENISSLIISIKRLPLARPDLLSSGYNSVVRSLWNYTFLRNRNVSVDDDTLMRECHSLVASQINPLERPAFADIVTDEITDVIQQARDSDQLVLDRPTTISTCWTKFLKNDFSAFDCDPITGLINSPERQEFLSNFSKIVNANNLNTNSRIGFSVKRESFFSVPPSSPSSSFLNGFKKSPAGIPPILAKSIIPSLGFVSSFKPVDRYSDEGCKCSREIFNDFMANLSAEDKEKRKNNVRVVLTSSVNKALGDKFKDKFTARFEDLNFFLSNNKEVFTSGPDSKKLACADAAGYVSAVNQKCGSLGAAERDTRLQAILGVPFSQFDKKLNEIAVSSMSIDIPSQKNADGTFKKFTRDDLDGQRLILLKDSKELKFMDQMILRIIKDPGMNQKIMSDTGTPSASISHLIAEWLRKNPEGLASLEQDIVTSEFGKSLKDLIKADDQTLLVSSLLTSMDLLMITHPGIKTVLSSKENVASLAAAANSKENLKEYSSAYKLLENQKDILNNSFEKRCHEMSEELAVAICTPSEDLLKNVNPMDVEHLASNLSHPPENLIIQQILCENRSQFPTMFKELNPFMTDHVNRSDYTTRTLAAQGSAPLDFLTLGMTRSLAKSPLSGYVQMLNEDAGRHRNSEATTNRIGGEVYARHSAVIKSDPSLIRKPGSDAYISRNESKNSKLGLMSQEQISHNSSTTEKMEKADFAKAESTIVGASIANGLRKVPSQGNSSVANNIVAPFGSTSLQDNLKKEEQARSELRETLSNSVNKERVNQLIDITDNSSVLELLRLKEQGLTNRQKLLDLANQNERAQNEELDRKLKKLQQKRAKAISDIDSESDELDASGPQKKSNQIRRDQSRGNASTTQSSDQVEASVIGGSIPGKPSAPAPVNLQGLRNAVLPTNATLAANSATRGPLVVISKASRTPGLEIKSSEMNLELINYLSENQADLSALLKIKDSGMLYRYKIVENGTVVDKEILVAYGSFNDDVKKLIDQKISQSGGQGESIVRMDNEIQRMQRAYSYSALKIILSEQLQNGTIR